nr:MAG TPA: hypothetical protein [Caudoviricetes sp.]
MAFNKDFRYSEELNGYSEYKNNLNKSYIIICIRR